MKKILSQPHTLSPSDFKNLKEQGYTDGEILEIIAHVIRNAFTNYVNTVSATELEWPAVELKKQDQ